MAATVIMKQSIGNYISFHSDNEITYCNGSRGDCGGAIVGTRKSKHKMSWDFNRKSNRL